MKYPYTLILFFLLIFSFSGCNQSTKENTEAALPYNKTEPELKEIVLDSTLFDELFSSQMKALYKGNHYKTFWLTNKIRPQLVSLLENSYLEGLNPKSYKAADLRDFENRIQELSPAEKITYDVILSKYWYLYLTHQKQGVVRSQIGYEDWDLPSNNISVDSMKHYWHIETNLEKELISVRPQHIVYKKLVKALELLEKYPETEFTPLPVDIKISPNETHEILPEIKARLQYWNDLQPQDSLTQIYDLATFDAVKKFQQRHGLDTDGIIGRGTLKALNVTKQERKEQILVNLERWRWFPRTLGPNYFIINIPDFMLHVVKNDDTIKSHKIIVGTPKRKTPVFSSRLSHLVFNPTWTIPPTIKKEDVIPATAKDIGYLNIKKITVYDRNKNIVPPEKWSRSEAASYTYVQSPGTFNSLGLVKFMFPNRFSVYLHDTNNRSLFQKAQRAVSSGCIRVENPFELTRYVLNENQWTSEKTSKIIESAKTQSQSISQQIDIHVLYWTAWSEGEDLHFREDLYNLDKEIYEKLRHQL